MNIPYLSEREQVEWFKAKKKCLPSGHAGARMTISESREFVTSQLKERRPTLRDVHLGKAYIDKEGCKVYF